MFAGVLVGGSPAPTVSAIVNDYSLTVGDTGTAHNVTITGTNFSFGVSAITICGGSASSIVVVNDTTVTCSTPTSVSSALGDVVVTGAGGSATLTNGYRLWTPASASPTLWCKDSIVQSGGTVTTWNDSSGNGRNLQNSGNKATYTSNLRNGYPGLTFAGTEGPYQSAVGVTMANIITASASTMYFMFKVTSISTNNVASYQNDALMSDFGGYYATYFRSGGPLVGLGWYTSADHVDTQSISTGTFYIIEELHSSGNIFTRLNNGTQSAGTGAGDLGSTASRFQVGSDYQISHHFTGATGEIVIYNTALNSTDQSYNRGYLLTRWAI